MPKTFISSSSSSCRWRRMSSCSLPRALISHFCHRGRLAAPEEPNCPCHSGRLHRARRVLEVRARQEETDLLHHSERLAATEEQDLLATVSDSARKALEVRAC